MFGCGINKTKYYEIQPNSEINRILKSNKNYAKFLNSKYEQSKIYFIDTEICASSSNIEIVAFFDLIYDHVYKVDNKKRNIEIIDKDSIIEAFYSEPKIRHGYQKFNFYIKECIFVFELVYTGKF